MIFEIKQGDLFGLEKDYALVHCIAHDACMGAGIAKTFRKKYLWLKPLVRNSLSRYEYKPRCIYVHYGDIKVFNLVTKKLSFLKPTYKTLQIALDELKEKCEINKIDKIAMPFIGCGLDKLDWNKVQKMICETFKDTDIEIQVRYL